MLDFSKYHGLGNDFILIDDPDGSLHLTLDQIRALCHRQTGIGADGILIRTFPPKLVLGETQRGLAGQETADHRMLLFNADGTPAEISGNGLRCFVLFLKERGYPVDHELKIETGGGILLARLIDDHTVESTMPQPKFPPLTGGLRGAESASSFKFQISSFLLSEKDLTFPVISVNVGNPHGVIFGPQRDIPFAEKYGPGLEKNPAFPEGANIEFVHVLDNHSCRFVVWERGAGITLACGSGSVAIACAGAALGHFASDQPIAVHQPGGTLYITVGKNFSEIRQRGPAVFVLRGEIAL